MELDTNLIYCSDSFKVLTKFPEKSVDLIYAEPPFFSNRHCEIIWGNGAEMKVYGDRWKGGINVYIEWMQERLWQCYRVLKDTGSMYLHCDWHASHRLRGAMDNIFGERNFRNEIIWFYKTGGVSKKHFGRKHDTILFYTKTEDYFFKPQKEKSYLMHKYGFSNIEIKKDAIGFYCEVFSRDVWAIPALRGNQPEKLSYPKQKPEALLKRIIEASSNKDNIVLDPFCGCGTTLAVAHQLDRKWIGIDVSPIACNVMKDRLSKLGVTNIRITGAPKTIDELKALEAFQFQNWVIDRIGGVPNPKKSADMGIDGYTFMAREPIQVKQSESVGRDVVDNFQTVTRRERKATGYIVAFSFTKSAYEEAARAKLEDGLKIKLVRVDKMDELSLID